MPGELGLGAASCPVSPGHGCPGGPEQKVDSVPAFPSQGQSWGFPPVLVAMSQERRKNAERGHVCAGAAGGESPGRDRARAASAAGSVTDSLTLGTIFP